MKKSLTKREILKAAQLQFWLKLEKYVSSKVDTLIEEQRRDARK